MATRGNISQVLLKINYNIILLSIENREKCRNSIIKNCFIIHAHAWKVGVNIFQVETHFFIKSHIMICIIQPQVQIFQITCKGHHFSGQVPLFFKNKKGTYFSSWGALLTKPHVLRSTFFSKSWVNRLHFSDRGPLFFQKLMHTCFGLKSSFFRKSCVRVHFSSVEGDFFQKMTRKVQHFSGRGRFLFKDDVPFFQKTMHKGTLFPGRGPLFSNHA